jgi:hypothetical protein
VTDEDQMREAIINFIRVQDELLKDHHVALVPKEWADVYKALKDCVGKAGG